MPTPARDAVIPPTPGDPAVALAVAHLGRLLVTGEAQGRRLGPGGGSLLVSVAGGGLHAADEWVDLGPVRTDTAAVVDAVTAWVVRRAD